MKIKITEASFDTIKPKENKNVLPKKQSKLLKGLVNLISKKVLKKASFSYTFDDEKLIDNKSPCLILMNHSSFIDLQIVHKIFKKRPFNIVTTDDAFIGMDFLLRHLGCIPALKFQSDITLVKNMKYTIDKLKSSIVLFPEASYSFDGTSSTLPDSIPGLIKYLNVPVIMVRTHGAFLRDPLYNNLQLRNAKVSADVKVLIKKEELSLPKEELFNRVKKEFEFDNFKEQQENNIKINEPFRADFLNRVLYKCPQCEKEGEMVGKGINITCNNCSTTYELSEEGKLKNINGETKFFHIPTWYRWQRESLRKEIIEEKYSLDLHGTVLATIDHKSVYKLGEGHLHHDNEGFVLKDDKNNVILKQSSLANYSLYSDYYWYEVGDIVSLGTPKIRYYIVLKEKDVVTKLRLASEEIFKFLTNKSKIA